MLVSQLTFGGKASIHLLLNINREPDPKKRLTFDMVYSELGSNPNSILKWESRNNHHTPLCSVLGAPLEHGQELYKDLQLIYMKNA